MSDIDPLEVDVGDLFKVVDTDSPYDGTVGAAKLVYEDAIHLEIDVHFEMGSLVLPCSLDQLERA